jgi:DNA polymerase-3 subunit delta'
MADTGSLPGSVLFEGRRGIGKQRLALWLAQLLVCERADRPCGACLACRSVLNLQHPDVFWVYPRPRLGESSATIDDINDDLREANSERVAAHGLYARPSGSEGIFLASTRAIVARAAMSPSMATRKMFIVGDAERMVAQEGSDQAANAFLKLLEEPPADTTIVLTSSEPGGLLPTIRSRLMSIRCTPLADAEVLAFVREPDVKAKLDSLDLPRGDAERVSLARGAPGDLLSLESLAAARSAALGLLDASSSPDAARYAAALAQGHAGARGAFSDTLAELNVILAERAHRLVDEGDTSAAYVAAKAAFAVTEAQARADGNVNPQLATAALLQALRHVSA